jgi:hypothetical protein
MRMWLGFACFAALVAAALVLAAAPAEAQRGCQAVEVRGVRHARVELYDLSGNLVRTAPRSALTGLTSATECQAVPAFLRIEFEGQRWLVRRVALDVNSGAVELPPCAADQYASQGSRNASSSGLGGASCRSD